MKCKTIFNSSTALFGVLLLGGYAAMTVAASAQGVDAVETVVVTGFREALASALAKKENSNLIIESVASEDIGKMPDMNVAESLQRLPGVQIDRQSGQGTQIRIRGLSYNATLLDGEIFVTGREMYQIGEASGGGNGNEYQNSMEGIPSELITGVDVYKSPDASLVAGGLGGTVNLHTRNALDGKEGLTLAAILKANFNQAADTGKPSATLVGSYNFNNKLGIVASLSWDDTYTLEYEMQAANRSSWVVAGPTSGVDNTVGKNYIEPEMMYLTHRTIERKRFGLSLGVDYNPTDYLQTSLTWFHSDLRTDARDISNKLWFHSNSLGLGLVSGDSYNINSDGVVMSGTFAANGAETSTMVGEDRDLADNIHFNAKFDNGGKLRLSYKFAFGRGTMNSQFAQSDQERSAYSVDSSNISEAKTRGISFISLPNGNGYTTNSCGGNGTIKYNACTFTYKNNDGYYPIISYTNPTDLLTNKNYGLFKSSWAWAIKNRNIQMSNRLDGEYDMMDNVKMSAGFRYQTHNVDYTFGRYLLNTEEDPLYSGSSAIYNGWSYYQDPGLPWVPVETFNSNPERLVTLNNFFPQAGLSSIVAQSPAQMAKCPSCWLQSINLNGFDMKFFKDPTNSFRIETQVSSGYFMIDLGGPSDDFHVNSGVRVVKTDMKITQGGVVLVSGLGVKYNGSASWNGVPVAGPPVVTSREYTDILPSLNVVYNVVDGQKIRFSAARVMAEQNYWQLGQGQYFNFTRETGGRTNTNTGLKDGFYFNGGSQGNANLDPYRANQLDLSYEYYFGKQGLLSAGIFWKGVDSFTETTTESVTVSDDFGGTAGGVTTYKNGAGGRIQGLELTAQYAFDFGLGFNANYTYAESRTANSDAFKKHLPFPGVASNAFTVQTYYENGPIEGRLSYTWKGSSFSQTFSVTTGASSTSSFGVFNRAYGQVDAQIGYKFLENLGLVFEARNLAGNATSQYLQYKKQPFTYNQSGRQYSLDLKFNY